MRVLKYTMIDALRQSYSQVVADIRALTKVTEHIQDPMELSYSINLLACPLNVDVVPAKDDPPLSVSFSPPKLVTDFSDAYRSILLRHAIQSREHEVSGNQARCIAIQDMRAVAFQIEKLQSEQEYNFSIRLEGKGGTAILQVERKSLTRLRFEASREVLVTLAVAALILVSGYALLQTDFGGLVFILGFVGFGVLGILVDRVRDKLTEIHDYERKRAAGLTPSRPRE
ncbi:MAG: hypothetical protein IT364_04725 [Candidatus Hydrogenedentes bacterium]|nr:hypothetical protein [Candidatus Hydrogenedentota bacterium]